MRQIIYYISNALPYMLCAIPVFVIVRAIWVVYSKRNGRKTNWLREVALLLFTVFCVGLASQTVIPKLEFGTSTGAIVNWSLASRYNLIPGMVFIDTYRECVQHGYWLYFVINFVGNIVLFIPIGFGCALLWKGITGKRAALIGFLTSLFIELCQLPQARGTDVDDLWLNVLGVMLGYWLYKRMERNSSAKKTFAKFKVSSGSGTGYDVQRSKRN